MRLLLIDNYDSFTYNLLDYFEQLGADCHVIRNDEAPVQSLSPSDYGALVISPGPKSPREAGITMELIDRWHQLVPILGICLGHQALGLYFGATLVRAQRPVHGKTSQATHSGHPVFSGLPSTLEVMRYHSLILEANDHMAMKTIAEGEGGEIMAIAHEHLPLIGLQFHPESVLTVHGLAILRNWLRCYVPALAQ
jgi:anthranilate synthase/aminodeoxychorismate synthase-like glutamine amidotransferase